MISIILTGNNTSAIKAIDQVGTASQKAASTSAVAFDASTSKIGRSISGVATAGATMGVPFASSLNLIGQRFDKASAGGKGFGSTISKIGAVEAVAAGAGVAVLATQVGDFVSQGREAAKVGRLTEAVIRSTGGSANVSAPQVAALADALSKKAGVDDELIQSGENVLLTFRSVRDEVGAGNDIFTQGTEAALNLSAAYGKDLQTSIILVGKALNDPIKGLGQLARAGVQFTQQQKDQIKALVESGHLLQAQKIILSEFQKEFAGAAAAAADPFSKASVQIENLKEDIGGKLIPIILGVGDAASAGVHGFQDLNSASDGVVGKVLAIGAAVPVSVFAIEKLGHAGAAIGGQFVKAGSAVGGALGLVAKSGAATGEIISGVGTASELAALKSAQATVAQGKLAEATTLSAAANARLEAAMAQLAVAEEGDVAAALEVTKAHDAATAALTRQTIAAERAAIATAESGVTSAAASTTSAGAQLGVGAGAALTGEAASLGVIAGAATIALAGLAAGIFIVRQAAQQRQEIEGLAADLLETGDAAKKAQAELSRIIAPDIGGRLGADLQTYSDALLSNADRSRFASAEAALAGDALKQEAIEFLGAGRAAHASAEEIEFYRKHNVYFAQGLREIENNIETAKGKLESLTKEYGAGAIKSAQLSAAQKQLRDDLTAVASGADRDGAASRRLAGDKAKVSAAGKIVASVERDVAAATNGATGSLHNNASAAKVGTFAYLGLADSVTTAAQAFDALNARASAPIVASINVDKAGASLSDALASLDAPPESASGGGGGGSTQTATAAAIDRASKELSVRDAMRATQTATSGVTDAELQLTQARLASNDAARAVTDAQQNLRTVQHGVARDSKEAQDAVEALDDAQRSAAGAKLDVKDAQRSLQQAKNDKPLAQLAVQDARAKLQADREGGADQATITRDEIALADARLAASAVDDTIRRAELALANARDSAQESSKAANKAQTDLNHTLKGYGPNSKEAKDAQRQLTDAQLAAQQAAQSLTSAQQGLVAAQDNVATSALGLRRAQADLRGELESIGGGGGGAVGKAKSAMDSYKIKLDEVKLKALEMANSVGESVRATGGSLAAQLGAEIGTLRDIISAQPRLAATLDPILAGIQADFVDEMLKHPVPSPLGQGGSGAKRGQGTVLRASGGPTGPGPASKEVPITAHAGEWVIRKSAVDKYGDHAMAAINAGKLELPKFAVGGPVDNRTISHVSAPNITVPRAHFSAAGGTTVNVTVNLHGPVMGADVGQVVVSEIQKHLKRNGYIAGTSISAMNG